MKKLLIVIIILVTASKATSFYQISEETRATKLFLAKLEARSGGNHEISARIINAPFFANTYELNTWFYDFKKIKITERKLRNLNTQNLLIALFNKKTQGIKEFNHREKWLVFSDFISSIIRHPPLTQPMYEDRTMVSHPLVLLALGEGRCGQTARIVVDIALANGYEARLVQLAAHLLAEVKYDGAWHFVDADAHFPIDDLRKLKNIPSVSELSHTPYLIDTLAARGWWWSGKDQRSTGNNSLSYAMFYPGVLLTSSMYFGEQILKNLYTGSPDAPREGLTYHYKSGSYSDWQDDKFYGWNSLISKKVKIATVPVEFFMPLPTILAPTIVYKNKGPIIVPIRFLPVYRPSVEGDQVFNVKNTKIDEYEIRVSKRSRGWDYDFRNELYMPARSSGDILITKNIKKYVGGLLGLDLTIDNDAGDIFIEVIPIDKKLASRGSYAWASAEIQVQIFPEKYVKWNYST